MDSKMYTTEHLATYGRRTDWLLIAKKGYKFLSVEVIEDGCCLKIYIIPEAGDISTGREEQDFKFKDKRKLTAKIIDNGKRILVSEVLNYVNTETIEGFEELFPIVEVDKISVFDDFLYKTFWEPHELAIKDHILMAKMLQMQNFRMPIVSPSFKMNSEDIVYKKGESPAIGKTAEWWYSALRNFMPEKNSRMCSELEYDVYLGTLIKYLVEEKGFDVYTAWNVVCSTSKGIAYFNDCEGTLEKTGSRPLGKWFDLSNTYKIIIESPKNIMQNIKGFFDTDTFMIAGLSYKNRAVFNGLADKIPVYMGIKNESDGVGLLVLDV